MRPERRSGGNPNHYHRKDAAQIRRSFIDWLDEREDRPFFAFLNIFDAHDPYFPPGTFVRRYSDRPTSAKEPVNLERWFIMDKKSLAPGAIQYVTDAYDDCITSLDEQLGILFRDLEARGLLENTLVIVTADHGEHLGEHALYGHASSLYDPEIHVPLVVHLPGGAHAGTTIRTPVSLRDLAATVADYTPLGAGAFPGRSLSRFWQDSASPLASEPALSEVDEPVKSAPNQGRSPVFKGAMKALIEDEYAYISSKSGREELYNLIQDPGQSNDRSSAPELRPQLERLRGRLARLLDERTPGVPR